MNKKIQFRLLLAIISLAALSCSSAKNATLSNLDAKTELDQVSAKIEEANRDQYDRIAPKSFDKAVDARNSASEKMNRGEDQKSIHEDIALADNYIQNVQRIAKTNESSLHGVLESRKFAVLAQAPTLDKNRFKVADDDLATLGRKLESGDYTPMSDELIQLEKRFGTAEIEARKALELSSTKTMIEKAKSDGAKKTPGVYEMAQVKMASANHAIEISPRDPISYGPKVEEAKQAARKLTEVLAISKRNSTTEKAAVLIWNQQQMLTASKDALTLEKAEAASSLSKVKRETDEKLAETQAAADKEQTKFEQDLAAKNARIDGQVESIAALNTENKHYANEEELKQKIEEIKKTFSSDEADVMKDGKNIVVRLKKMQFLSGRAELSPDSYATLRKVDNLIAAVPTTQVMVEGHTDSTGTNEKNKELSEKRAETVKKYLMSEGLSESVKIDTAGYGSDRPLTTNKTKKGRASNRRVDIVIETPAVL